MWHSNNHVTLGRASAATALEKSSSQGIQSGILATGEPLWQ